MKGNGTIDFDCICNHFYFKTIRNKSGKITKLGQV
jgi:hypothetical protein